MEHRTGRLDQAANAARKQASRDRDERRLASGEVGPAELAAGNGIASAFEGWEFRMVRKGSRPLKHRPFTDWAGDA